MHLGRGKRIPIRFDAYERTHQTSALAAVQYGPSANMEGLRFVASRGGGWIATPVRGKALAVALDGLLRVSDSYGLFERVDMPATLPRDKVLDLAGRGVFLARDFPERPERDPYIDALFSLDVPEQPDTRRSTLSILLHLVGQLDDGEGVHAGDIRQSLLGGQYADLDLPKSLVPQARRWQVFQLRQLQRYALEVWLALAVERTRTVDLKQVNRVLMQPHWRQEQDID